MEDNKENLSKFSTVLWDLAEIFGGDLSEAGLHLRFEALKEFSIDEISSAGTYLLKYRKAKFPAVPTVKEFIDILEKRDKSLIEEEANSQVDYILKNLRDGTEPYFADPITHDLMKNRWPYYSWCSTVLEEKDLVWWRKAFVHAYIKRYKAAAPGGVRG